MRAATTRQDEYAADVDFHLAVAQATQNDVFVRLVRTIRELIQHMLWQSPAQRASRVEEHARILRAIEDRDQVAAAQAIHEHFHETEERARALLREATRVPMGDRP